MYLFNKTPASNCTKEAFSPLDLIVLLTCISVIEMVFQLLILYTLCIWSVHAQFTKNDQKNDSDWKCLIRFYSFWYSCGIQNRTGILTSKWLFCYTNAMFNTRGYKKWLFLTGIRPLYGKRYMYRDLFYFLRKEQ